MPNNRPKIKGNALTGLNSVIDGIGIITKPLKTSAVTANTASAKLQLSVFLFYFSSPIIPPTFAPV
ncbi:hypothetical protein ACR2E0_001474 [Phascolarctobacterium faecium]|uniref:hypothetical protein n=1 Tax=Phascolarctobacterium faecium TaxID=33025 RepID=UPI003AF1400A